MSVNGQAKTHTDNPEKELEPEAAEEAVENGPKGMVWHVCVHPDVITEIHGKQGRSQAHWLWRAITYL